MVSGISDVFSVLSALQGATGGRIANPLVLAGLSASPFIDKVIPEIIDVISENPQEAAKLARQATKILASLIKVDAGSQETNADNGVTKVSETTTTTRRESGPDGIKITKTTTTTSTTTIDPKKQAAYQKGVADKVENFGKGLEEGKIQVGDEVVTFEELKELIATVEALLEKAGKRQNDNKSESVIDMTEGEPNNNPGSASI